MIRNVQRTAEGTTFTMVPLSPEDTPESLAASGRYFNPTLNAWEFPRGLEDVDVQGGVERLPMQGDAAQGMFTGEELGIAPLVSGAAGVARGLHRVAGGAYGLLGQAADRLGLDGIGNAMIDQANAYQNTMGAINAPFLARAPVSNPIGSFVGETIASAPAAGVGGQGIRVVGQGVGRFAPQVGRGIEAFGRSVAAGGFTPSAVGRPAAGMAPSGLERAGNILLRGGGGATAGALGTAITAPDGGGNESGMLGMTDTQAGAAIGAILPTVAARPAKFAMNRLMDGYQALVGELGATRAAAIVRQSLGVDYDAALAALRNAAPDVTAQQALVDAGVEPSVFMGVGAAARGAAPDAFLGIEAAQAAARQAPIDRLAGGANLTAAQLSQRGEKQALRAALVPEQARELAAADASGALDVAPVAALLMQQADAPGVGTTNARVLAEVASALEAMAARRGGVPSAEDIYAFRKDDLDDIITRALSTGRGGEVTSQAARRGELVRSTQDMLDSAIETAGGTGWRDYLANYASGMRAVERQQMMGVAGRQLRQSPNEFVNLVGGESPSTVEGVFGPGRIDLANLMNPTGVGPSPMEALTRASGEIQRDARVRTLAQEGGGAARELLQQSGGGGRIRGMATLVGRVLRPGTAAAMDVGSALLDAKIAPQVRRELAQAYQSGANMTELLAMTPLADRAQVQRNLMNPAFWAHLQGGAVNAMMGNGEQPANTMSPAPQ